MVTRSASFLFAACVLLSTWLSPTGKASAELKACGGIFVSSEQDCEYRPKQECMTECMTTAVEESCVTEVYNECQSSCTTTSTTECESSCTASCMGGCMTRTTTDNAPTCTDLCLSDCRADDPCQGREHRERCGRCSKFNCEKKCEARCGDETAQPRVTTSTQCMSTCNNACSASCTAKVNTQCQLDCQERTYTQCEQKMVEHCETQCKDKGGAIFCDGQFVNASSANDCAGELKAKVHIDIDIDAALKSAGDGIEATASSASKAVDTHCAVSSVGMSRNASGWLALAPLLGAVFWRMRRRSSKR